MTTQAEVFHQIRALGFSVRKVDGEFQVKPFGTNWDGPETYFTDDLDDALGTARDLAARGHANMRDRALAVINNARNAGCRVDAGNVVDLLADNIPAPLDTLREVAASLNLDLPASDAGHFDETAGEGFPVYFASRAALEAAILALNDKIERVTCAHTDWQCRANRARAGTKFAGECQRAADKHKAKLDALREARAAMTGAYDRPEAHARERETLRLGSFLD